jgi:hypothetical protein
MPDGGAPEVSLVPRLRDEYEVVGYGETELTFASDIEFETWQTLGATLGRMAESVMWWLGDWWRYGEHHYGEAAAQAAPTGYARGTLQEAARVADRIEPPRRLGSLSWSHHQAVAALDEPVQDALLRRAVEEHLSVRDLRHEAQRAKSAVVPPLNSEGLLAQARRDLGEVQARIDAADRQAAVARDERVALWRAYSQLGVQKKDLAQMSGVSPAAINAALATREER